MTMTYDQWLAERMKGIGASEISALYDYYCLQPNEPRTNPYTTALEIYGRKLGILPPQEMSEEMKWGLRHEPAIAQDNTERTGILWTKGEMTKHIEEPRLFATPDFVNDDLSVGLECKNVGIYNSKLWGGEDVDIMPDYVRLQVQVQMDCTGFVDWQLDALIGGNKIRHRELKADPELQGGLRELAARFWRDHIEKQVPPPLDGSDSSYEFLKARFPKSTDLLLPASSEVIELAEQLKTIKEFVKHNELKQAELENLIKAEIGEAAGIEGVATWKSNKDSEKTDWKAAFLDVEKYVAIQTPQSLIPMVAKDFREIIKKHTKIVAGARVFRLKGTE